MALTCRFYEQKFPEIEDVVMVNVRSIADMGAYVHLLEYNNIEGKFSQFSEKNKNQNSKTLRQLLSIVLLCLITGMILLSELSRRRIRSINKLIRVGRTEPVVVIRVDKDKGYIDLSKRRVSPEDIERCTEVFSKGKVCENIHIPLTLTISTSNSSYTFLFYYLGSQLNTSTCSSNNGI